MFESIAVVIWLAVALLAFAAGMAGIASTKRRLAVHSSPAPTSADFDHPVSAL